MRQMEFALNGRLDSVTLQLQKMPEGSREISGTIASARIPNSWATSDLSFDKLLPPVEEFENADSAERHKTLTEHRRCNCAKILRRQAKSFWASTWSVSWSESTTSRHLKACQYWYPSQEVWTTKLSVSHVNFLAAMALAASIGISKGAGKYYRISPSLTLRGVVNGSSPAFALLKDLRKLYWDNASDFLGAISKLKKRTSLLARSVRRLLKEGTVSPHEVDENGRTLLHYALSCNQFPYMLDKIPAFGELVHTLLDAHVAINEVDLAGQTAFDYLISNLDWYFARKGERNLTGELLANNGAEMSEVFLKESTRIFKMSVEMHSISMLEPWQDATECGPLSLAILRESEQDVIRILRAKPSSINELNRRKLNPMHLANCWPRGIQLLLDAGANYLVHQADICGGLPITYSIQFRCFDAIELLLNAGSALSSPGWICDWEEVLEILEREDEIPLFLLSTLQERRRKLLDLAKLTLPAEVWADLDVPADRLLDGRAAEIQRVLIDADIEIPNSISVRQWHGTVYHGPIMLAKQADQLWDAGFRDIDSPNERGHTPIMLNAYRSGFEYDQWLLDHGADLHGEGSCVYHNECGNEKSVAGLTKLHYVAHDLPQNSMLLLDPKVPPAQKVAIEPLITFERLLVENECHDDCYCACSSGGCAPFTSLLKAMSKREGLYERIPKESSRRRRLLLQQLESPGHPASSAPMLSNIVEKVIRFETFEALDLNHTCCEFDFYKPSRRYTPEEVQEVHEEWEELLSKHEDLVSEFCHKFQELGGTLTSFLEGYWQTRMDEVLKEEKPYSEEDIQRLREIGVVLEQVSEETEKDVTDQDLTDGDLTDEDQSEGSDDNAEEGHEHNQGV